jgi:hypothetical protein
MPRPNYKRSTELLAQFFAKPAIPTVDEVPTTHQPEQPEQPDTRDQHEDTRVPRGPHCECMCDCGYDCDCECTCEDPDYEPPAHWYPSAVEVPDFREADDEDEDDLHQLDQDHRNYIAGMQAIKLVQEYKQQLDKEDEQQRMLIRQGERRANIYDTKPARCIPRS